MPESTTTEQTDTDTDDWTAAMAEQASATKNESEATTAPAETDASTDPKADAEAGTESDAIASTDTEVKDGAVSDTQTASTTVFEEFSKDGVLSNTRNDIDMILDIPVQLTVELGRTKITIKNLLQLAQGSVVELDGLAGEPMDVLVNGCLIAQGEVVVVNEKFGIRLTDVITPSERIRKLNR
tara:strand:+ start:1679 stop:2227 length:549 start_codon:yes stop_codon:yes gene_type:complete